MRGTKTVAALAAWVALSWLVCRPASAQLVFTALGAPATETFATYRGTGFAPSPAAGQLDSDAWVINGASDGTMTFGDTRVTGDFARGQSVGGVTTGGVYAFEIGAGNFALGVQSTSSDFTPGSVELRARNDTALNVTSVRVEFTGAFFNDQTRSTEVTTLYSTDGAAFTLFGVPFATPGPAAAVPAWASTPSTATITGLTIPPGGFLFVRFNVDDVPGSGSRDELALDVVTVTALTGTAPCTSAADCDDVNPCTTNVCTAGVCTNPPTPMGSSCPDADRCNGDETCDGMGLCQPGTPLACDDFNPCTADSCAPATGCANAPVADGTSCADADMCNGAEVCAAGACAAGTPLTCDDANPCTTDGCDATSGCVNTVVAAGTSCGDGDLCNGDEVCMGTTCMSGTALDCDDSNPCTSDACDPATGCANPPLMAGTSCANADLCDGEETCDGAGTCAAGAALDCDDGDACTTDRCDPSAGCDNEPVPMCESDAGPGSTDGGLARDGGASLDAAMLDAAVGGDGGPGGGEDGCSCRVGGRRGAPSGWWLVGGLVALALRRRRL